MPQHPYLGSEVHGHKPDSDVYLGTLRTEPLVPEVAMLREDHRHSGLLAGLYILSCSCSKLLAVLGLMHVTQPRRSSAGAREKIMKCLKILGLAAVAITAMSAFVGVGSASATVLCKTALTSGCAGSSWDYAAGTTFHLSQEAGTSLLLSSTSGFLEKTCIDSTTKGSTLNTGSSSETVKINVNVYAISGCTNTMETLELGELEIHWISGTDNGTVTARGFKWTTRVNGIGCVYGYGEGVDFGILTGGSMATIDYHAVVPKREGSFLCASDVVLDGKYTVTSPEPLYVSES
jgi:hypothetical protein